MNLRVMVGDERARDIEAKARKDAEASKFAPPERETPTYQSGLMLSAEHVTYALAYDKRVQRLQRKGAA